MGVDPADLANLTVDEKLTLISELWDSIAASKAIPSLSIVQDAELARRRAEGSANAPATVDWASVREELFRKP